MNTAVLSPQGQSSFFSDLLRKLGFRGKDDVVAVAKQDDRKITKQGKIYVEVLDNGCVLESNYDPRDNSPAAQAKRGKRASKALRRFVKDMDGLAEKAGWTCEQDVVDFIKQLRREKREKEYANNA